MTALVCGLTVSAAGAAEQLVMPHRCIVDEGRLLLLSAGETAYPIIGPRTQQPVSTCRSGSGCEDFTAHQFAIACEGGAVAWVQVAAALSHQKLGPSTVDGGQLRIRLPDAPIGRADAAKRKAADLLAFPAGHGPVDVLGARIVQGAPESSDASSPPMRGEAHGDTARSATIAGWLTIVEPEPTSKPWGSAMSAAAVASAAVLVLATAALTISRARFWLLMGAVAMRRAMRRTFGRRDGPDAIACQELEAIACEILTGVEDLASRLARAKPLRRVLLRELERHRRRLAAARALAPGTPEGWRRLRARLETLITDAVRLREIVDGAVRTLDSSSGSAASAGMLSDRRSAYETLGVAPEVNDRVVKKLVEALRACWHPDLAKDEADRRRREDRIKEINVAWDLISGKRQEA